MIEVREKNPARDVFLELRERADWLCLQMFLGRRVELTKYGKENGKIESEFMFDYDDPKAVEKITAILDQEATQLRDTWESEYLRFASALSSLQWGMETDLDGVNIVDLSKDESDEEYIVNSFAYNEVEFQMLGTFISEALANGFIPPKGAKKCSGNCPECPMAGMWEHCQEKLAEYETDGEEEKEFFIDEAVKDLAERFDMTAEELKELAAAKGLSIIAAE